MARKRSLSLIRRRAAPVMRCLPGTAAITAASAGMRSGTSRTSTVSSASGKNSVCAARSPLRGSGVEALHGHSAAQRVGRQPEGRARPVALDAHLARRLVALVAGDAEAARRFFHRYAEGAHGREGQVDIGGGFQRRIGHKFTVLRKQRQGEEQASEELAGDVARQAVFPAAQPAGDRQGQTFGGKGRAVGAQGREQRPVGALGQAAMASERRAAIEQRAERQEEAQRRAALAAVQQGVFPWDGDGGARAGCLPRGRSVRPARSGSGRWPRCLWTRPRPVSSVSPSASAAQMRARWAWDLEGGACTCPCNRPGWMVTRMPSPPFPA